MAVAQSSTKLHPAEAAQGLPACLFWRSVPLSENSFVRLPPMLPPGQLDASVAALATAFPSWSELSIISSVWSFEAFFQARAPAQQPRLLLTVPCRARLWRRA